MKQFSKVAVNKSFDFFLRLIKTLKVEDFSSREIKIQNETIDRLLTFRLNPEDLEEAKAMLMQRINEKFEELKAQWQRDLNEKEEREAISHFLRKERSRINKIYDIKELLENGSIDSGVEEFSKTLSKELTSERKQELSQKVTKMVTNRLSYLKEYNLPKILDKYQTIHRNKLENHFISFDQLPASDVLERMKLETEDELKAELRSLKFTTDEETIGLQILDGILQTSTKAFLRLKQTTLDQRNSIKEERKEKTHNRNNNGEESPSLEKVDWFHSPSNVSLCSDVEWTPNVSTPEFSDQRDAQDKPNSIVTTRRTSSISSTSNSIKPEASSIKKSQINYGTITQPISSHSTLPNPREPMFTQDSDQETNHENGEAKSMIERELVHQEATFKELLAASEWNACFDRDKLMDEKTRSLLFFAGYLTLQEPLKERREFYSKDLDEKIEALIAEHLARNTLTPSVPPNQQETRPQTTEHLDEDSEFRLVVGLR